MPNIAIDPEWIVIGVALLLVAAGGFWGVRALPAPRTPAGAARAVGTGRVRGGASSPGPRRHGRVHPHRSLAAHAARRARARHAAVAGLIFGGDQMSDWTVIGGAGATTFDNPQPALYDRIAAVKALVGEVPVEGRLLFSNVGKFTKGIPKWVLMLDGIEVEFPVVDGSMRNDPAFAQFSQAWSRLVGQLRPSPHLFTNL